LELYSENKNELPSHEKTQKNLKCSMLSERSKIKKAVYYMMTSMDILEKAKPLMQSKDQHPRVLEEERR
jgi:hypothetical protein